MHDRHEACPRMLQYRPPRIALALVLFASLPQLLLPGLLPPLPASVAGGLIVGAAGFAVMMRAWWLFRRHETAICPTAEAGVLIRDDVYAMTRNPMYLGIIGMLLGVAIGTGGLAFYVAAVAFFLIIDFSFCPHEERTLERLFGDDFERYRRQVRRWL